MLFVAGRGARECAAQFHSGSGVGMLLRKRYWGRLTWPHNKLLLFELAMLSTRVSAHAWFWLHDRSASHFARACNCRTRRLPSSSRWNCASSWAFFKHMHTHTETYTTHIYACIQHANIHTTCKHTWKKRLYIGKNIRTRNGGSHALVTRHNFGPGLRSVNHDIYARTHTIGLCTKTSLLIWIYNTTRPTEANKESRIFGSTGREIAKCHRGRGEEISR